MGEAIELETGDRALAGLDLNHRRARDPQTLRDLLLGQPAGLAGGADPAAELLLRDGHGLPFLGP